MPREREDYPNRDDRHIERILYENSPRNDREHNISEIQGMLRDEAPCPIESNPYFPLHSIHPDELTPLPETIIPIPSEARQGTLYRAANSLLQGIRRKKLPEEQPAEVVIEDDNKAFTPETFDEFVAFVRQVVGQDRAAKLQAAGVLDELFVLLRDSGAKPREYFTTLMTFMPESIFDEMLARKKSWLMSDFTSHISCTIEIVRAVGKQRHSVELQFARLIEAAFGGKEYKRFAATAGFIAYAAAKEEGLQETGTVEMAPERAVQLREELTEKYVQHQERMEQIAPLQKSLPEPLSYGIEIELNPVISKRLPLSANLTALIDTLGWKRGLESSGIELKSRPTKDIELLAEELRVLNKLGMLPFAPTQKDTNNMRLAQGIHLTTAGIRALDGEEIDSEVRFLHHTDEATARMSAFDFGEHLLARQTAMNKGEIKARKAEHGKLENGNTYAVEQRSFIAYDLDQFIEGLRTHVVKTQALAAFQQIPDAIRQRMAAGSNPFVMPEYVNDELFFEGRMKQPWGWNKYLKQVEGAIPTQDVADLNNPLIYTLAREWVWYRAKAAAMFKAAYLPDPFLEWNSSDGEAGERRPALFNRINQIFVTPEDYFTDPSNYAERKVQLGKAIYANPVHAIRSLDSQLERQVGSALDIYQPQPKSRLIA